MSRSWLLQGVVSRGFRAFTLTEMFVASAVSLVVIGAGFYIASKFSEGLIRSSSDADISLEIARFQAQFEEDLRSSLRIDGEATQRRFAGVELAPAGTPPTGNRHAIRLVKPLRNYAYPLDNDDEGIGLGLGESDEIVLSGAEDNELLDFYDNARVLKYLIVTSDVANIVVRDVERVIDSSIDSSIRTLRIPIRAIDDFSTSEVTDAMVVPLNEIYYTVDEEGRLSRNSAIDRPQTLIRSGVNRLQYEFNFGVASDWEDSAGLVFPPAGEFIAHPSLATGCSGASCPTFNHIRKMRAQIEVRLATGAKIERTLSFSPDGYYLPKAQLTSSQAASSFCTTAREFRCDENCSGIFSDPDPSSAAYVGFGDVDGPYCTCSRESDGEIVDQPSVNFATVPTSDDLSDPRTEACFNFYACNGSLQNKSLLIRYACRCAPENANGQNAMIPATAPPYTIENLNKTNPNSVDFDPAYIHCGVSLSKRRECDNRAEQIFGIPDYDLFEETCRCSVKEYNTEGDYVRPVYWHERDYNAICGTSPDADRRCENTVGTTASGDHYYKLENTQNQQDGLNHTYITMCACAGGIGEGEISDNPHVATRRNEKRADRAQDADDVISIYIAGSDPDPEILDDLGTSLAAGSHQGREVTVTYSTGEDEFGNPQLITETRNCSSGMAINCSNWFKNRSCCTYPSQSVPDPSDEDWGTTQRDLALSVMDPGMTNDQRERYVGYCRPFCTGNAAEQTEIEAVRRIITGTPAGGDLPVGCGGVPSGGTTGGTTDGSDDSDDGGTTIDPFG